MDWMQRTVTLTPKERGFHLVTDEVLQQLPEISEVRVGLLHVFIQHTSASLTINENAAPAVRTDMERHFEEMVPEGQPYYEHTIEGPDDMPAHLRAAMLPVSLSIPVHGSRMQLGTWQGIYVFEHRDHPRRREVAAMLISTESIPERT